MKERFKVFPLDLAKITVKKNPLGYNDISSPSINDNPFRNLFCFVLLKINDDDDNSKKCYHNMRS